MVVITKNVWEDDDPPTKSEKPTSIIPEPEFFGFQDLTSDYYQVLRAKGRPRICRIIWSVITLGLLILTGFMVYKLVKDFFEYNSFNKIQVKFESSMKLPALTICSTNSINYTALEAQIKDEEPELLNDFNEFLVMSELFKGEDVTDYFNLDDFKELIKYQEGEFAIRQEYGNNVYDMILQWYYLFGGKKVALDDAPKANFTTNTELGQCLNFNDDGKFVQRIRGPRGGFTIDLFAGINNYLLTTRTRGFIVFLRDQNEHILLNQGGYVIQPGTETYMRLDRRTVKRLGKPHGTCQDTQSHLTKAKHSRTVRECVQNNTITTMIETCNCIPWYYASSLYSLNQTDMLDQYVKEIQGRTMTDTPSDVDSRRKRSSGDRLRRAEENPDSNSNPDNGNGNPDGRNEESTDEAEPPTEEEKTIFKTKYNKHVCKFTMETLCNFLLESTLTNTSTSTAATTVCPEPCQFNEWEASLGVTIFPPSERYFKRFIQEEVFYTDSFTYADALANVARIHIYYDELKYTQVEQEKAYEIQNFVAEFGGTVDLFIGFSFFTVFQLLEIAVAVFVFRVIKRKLRRKDSLPAYDGGEKGENVVIYNLPQS